MTTAGVLIARAKRQLTLVDYLALALATWGVGFLPIAPGTFGSMVGVGLYLALGAARVRLLHIGLARGWGTLSVEALDMTFMLAFITLIVLVGVWSASRAEKLLQRKDPGVVVVDEVAGQLIALLFVPVTKGSWVLIAVGFLSFRLFDIWKPYPIRRLEALEAGLGIMADDVLAGAYAAVLVSGATAVYLLFGK